jgi:hypothetical protein
MYLAVSLLTVDPNRRLRENATTDERGKEQKKDAKNVPGIRADYARRERCTRVPLLFVDVVGTDVPTNADRMEREENMMLPFSIFFPSACCDGFDDDGVFLLEAERFFLGFLPSISLKKRGKKETEVCL